jgi:hypothetical protein
MDAELLCDRECIICLDNKETEWITLDCRHEYHKKCIHHWMQIRMICPICIRTIQLPFDEIVEDIPDATDDEFREYCQRGVSHIICALILLASLSILVGTIISAY